MAKARFSGEVRGYSVEADGEVRLTVDDTEVSQDAMYYVHDMEKSFNPSSPLHGYGAKDIPCTIKPGLASYYFKLPREKCGNITYGTLVDVEIDIFLIRRVRFHNKRWASFIEMRHELISIRPLTEARHNGAKSKDADTPANK